jgi:hypothetical protein
MKQIVVLPLFMFAVGPSAIFAQDNPPLATSECGERFGDPLPAELQIMPWPRWARSERTLPDSFYPGHP